MSRSWQGGWSGCGKGWEGSGKGKAVPKLGTEDAGGSAGPWEFIEVLVSARMGSVGVGFRKLLLQGRIRKS